MRAIHKLAISIAAVTPLLAGAQGHDVQPSPALKDVSFMLGSWSGKQDFNTGGAAMVLNVKDLVAPAVGGRYIEERLSTTRPDGSASDNRHYLTYLPKEGKYHAWWFNDTSAGPMELEGGMEGGKLVLMSSPTATGGGPQNVFRATYEQTPGNGLAFTLELKDGDSWRKLFRSEYTRT